MKNSNKFKFALAVFSMIVIFAVTAIAQTGELSIKPVYLQVDNRTDYVNVMGDEMPVVPEFPTLAKKPGFVRGYVKNTLGEPIVGAKLGLKTARLYDAYGAASAETDGKGYYEIKIPLGGGHFDYAGYTLQLSRGLAALGLHPADGNLSESYPAATGGVENFVMLPYGVADREGVSRQANYRGNYYGGSFKLIYYTAPPGQSPDDFAGMVAAGSEIEIILKPISTLSDGNNFARAFIIRKKVEESSIGEFYICNLPIACYEMEVKQANGKSLKMRQKSPTSSVFGIQPQETTDSAQLIFNPLSADAKTAVASRGNWTDLEIIVRRP